MNNLVRTVNAVFLIVAIAVCIHAGFTFFVNTARTETMSLSVPDLPIREYSLRSEYTPFSFNRDFFSQTQNQNTALDNLQEAPDFSSQFTVLGLLVGTHSQAIVSNKQTGESLFLFPGDSIAGAKLISVQTEYAVFEYNGQNVILKN